MGPKKQRETRYMSQMQKPLLESASEAGEMMTRKRSGRSYKKLIESWHAKATKVDYFSKFVFEYLAFIAFINTQLSIGVQKDRDSIQELKGNEDIKKQYLKLVEKIKSLNSAWAKIKKELDERPLGNTSRGINNVEENRWWNCSHNDIKQKIEEEKRKLKGVIHSLDDWENMVEFWYSIRNNLFHGTKNPEVERDKFLVEYGYKTLRHLVEIFLKKAKS